MKCYPLNESAKRFSLKKKESAHACAHTYTHRHTCYPCLNIVLTFIDFTMPIPDTFLNH